MRARNRQHPAIPQYMVSQPLRAGGVRRSCVKNGFGERIAARDHVADHKAIWFQRELIGRIALNQLNTKRAQLVRHRRIDVGVGAGDANTRLASQRGNTTHKGAANTKNVNVHTGAEGGARSTSEEATRNYRRGRVYAPLWCFS